ncbi:uncharacterized protein METZ01_LOCUS497390 [marine metagenome]|uniref:Uncharacterized protein n=1 Tax=marine metagenome TaxID=408172 RepID=A0A383DJ58_9ZZZZ
MPKHRHLITLSIVVGLSLQIVYSNNGEHKTEEEK